MAGDTDRMERLVAPAKRGEFVIRSKVRGGWRPAGVFLGRIVGIALFLVIVMGGVPVRARDYHVTPDGSGARDGSDWGDAMDRHTMVTLLAETVEPGDRVRLGSGTYLLVDHHGTKSITLRRGGRPGKAVVIEGVDTGGGLPQITGRYSVKNPRYHAHCYNGVAIAEDVSHVRIAHLRIRGYMLGVRTFGGHTRLDIEAIDVRHCREGFRLRGVADSTFRRCVAASYTKRGMRIESGCHHLRVADSRANATGGEPEWETENYPFGFAVESHRSNHHIRFERCAARNNLWRGEATDYWNGDGFTAEDEAHHIAYDRCAAFDNADGGWDNKSRASSLTRCVAAGNKRNFRVWNVNGDAQHPTTLTDCLGVNPVQRGGTGGALALWVRGHSVATRCTFVGGEGAAVGLAVTDDAAGVLTLRQCIVVAEHGDPIREQPGTTCTAVECVTSDPQFTNPSPHWRGVPEDAYDSTRPGKTAGYHSDSRSR
jgi:hypothetical protein